MVKVSPSLGLSDGTFWRPVGFRPCGGRPGGALQLLPQDPPCACRVGIGPGTPSLYLPTPGGVCSLYLAQEIFLGQPQGRSGFWQQASAG